MKNKLHRRDFLQYSGLGLAALTAAPVLTSCAKEEPYKFWHEGNYPPVSEEVTLTDLKVEGTIPPELNGLYVRNGPNEHTGPSNHFFGGDGMLHGVQLGDGKAAWYRNRYVNTPVVREEVEGFGMPRLENTTSAVSLIYHAGKLLSLGEFGYPYEIDPSDLSTKGVYTFDDKLVTSMTAHPRIDPLTGELVFFGYNFVKPYVTYYRANAAGQVLQVESIETQGPTMMHDFAVTENYVVFMEMPITFSWLLAITGDGLPFRWDNDAVCRFGVMPRSGGSKDVKWFDIPPCFVFHVMNSFEQGDDVIVDAARYDQLWVKDSHDFNHPAYLSRFSMNMKTGKASVTRMFDRPMEFPQVHRGHWTRPYRYGYSLITDLDGTPFGEMVSETATGFMKYDLQTGATDAYEIDINYGPNEAFFVPHNALASEGPEDEGFLMSFVYDKTARTSALWIMDTSAMAAGPIAKIQLPVRVPQGFHGLWLPTDQLA